MIGRRKSPMPGNVHQTVVELNSYDGASGRYDTPDPADAQVVTSMVEESWIRGATHPTHRPVLDIDLPAQLVPSSTPGHFHLYLDVEVEHENYMLLLRTLALCGIIEPGYASASQERGYTAVRLPWVKKPDPAVQATIDELLASQTTGEPF